MHRMKKYLNFELYFQFLNGSSSSTWYLWLNLFFPILEHFCSRFVQIAQMGLILPRWGLTLPRVPPPTLFLLSRHIPLSRTQNTLNPTLKHPIFWPELESGQNWQLSGQNGPQLGKMWKVSKSFLEVGKKNYSSGNWVRPTTRNCLIFGLQRKLMMFSQPFSKFLTMQPKKKTSLE